MGTSPPLTFGQYPSSVYREPSGWVPRSARGRTSQPRTGSSQQWRPGMPCASIPAKRPYWPRGEIKFGPGAAWETINSRTEASRKAWGSDSHRQYPSRKPRRPRVAPIKSPSSRRGSHVYGFEDSVTPTSRNADQTKGSLVPHDCPAF